MIKNQEKLKEFILEHQKDTYFGDFGRLENTVCWLLKQLLEDAVSSDKEQEMFNKKVREIGMEMGMRINNHVDYRDI